MCVGREATAAFDTQEGMFAFLADDLRKNAPDGEPAKMLDERLKLYAPGEHPTAQLPEADGSDVYDQMAQRMLKNAQVRPQP